jgi:hypothetical protein
MQSIATAMANLREGFEGVLVAPDDPAYDEARKVWNGTIDRRTVLATRAYTRRTLLRR